MENKLTLLYLAKKYKKPDNKQDNKSDNKIEIDKKYYKKNKKQVNCIIKKLFKNKIDDSIELTDIHNIYVNNIINYLKLKDKKYNNIETPDNKYNKGLMNITNKTSLDNFIIKTNINKLDISNISNISNK